MTVETQLGAVTTLAVVGLVWSVWWICRDLRTPGAGESSSYLEVLLELRRRDRGRGRRWARWMGWS